MSDLINHITQFMSRRGYAPHDYDIQEYSKVLNSVDGSLTSFEIEGSNEFYFLAMRTLPANFRIDSPMHSLLIKDTNQFAQVENYYMHVFSGKITIISGCQNDQIIAFTRVIPTNTAK